MVYYDLATRILKFWCFFARILLRILFFKNIFSKIIYLSLLFSLRSKKKRVGLCYLIYFVSIFLGISENCFTIVARHVCNADTEDMSRIVTIIIPTFQNNNRDGGTAGDKEIHLGVTQGWEMDMIKWRLYTF